MQDKDDFLQNPNVLSQYNLLQDLGVFNYIDTLKKDIRNYEAIINAAKTILNSKTIDDILESAVKEISDRFLPSFLIFLWKPLSSHKDLVFRGYRNFQTFDTSLQIEDLAPFNSFFKSFIYTKITFSKTSSSSKTNTIICIIFPFIFRFTLF